MDVVRGVDPTSGPGAYVYGSCQTSVTDLLYAALTYDVTEMLGDESSCFTCGENVTSGHW